MAFFSSPSSSHIPLPMALFFPACSLLPCVSLIVTHRGELGLLAPAMVGSYLLEDRHLLVATPLKQMTTPFLSTITAYNPWWRDRCSTALPISVGWILCRSCTSNYSHLAFLNAMAMSHGHITVLLPRWILNFFRYLFSTVPRVL